MILSLPNLRLDTHLHRLPLIALIKSLNHVHVLLKKLHNIESWSLMAIACMLTTLNSLNILLGTMCNSFGLLLISLTFCTLWILDCFHFWNNIRNKGWRTCNATMSLFGRWVKGIFIPCDKGQGRRLWQLKMFWLPSSQMEWFLSIVNMYFEIFIARSILLQLSSS